jgi:ubiquinone/menaquinone biosynthesis C-methylase UbiE
MRQRAARFKIRLNLLACGAEAIPMPDACVEFAVGTLVLCSVNDPPRVLREIHRILRDGSRYVFLEHVAAKQSAYVQWEQRLLRRPWKFLFNGCRIDQDALSLIEAVHFDTVAYEEFAVGHNLLPFSPHVAGSAIK